MNELGKFFRSFLYLAFLALVSNTAYCNSQIPSVHNHQKEEKIYLSPEQIKITDQAILVWLSDGETYLAKSLGVDNDGFYVKQLTKGP